MDPGTDRTVRVAVLGTTGSSWVMNFADAPLRDKIGMAATPRDHLPGPRQHGLAPVRLRSFIEQPSRPIGSDLGDQGKVVRREPAPAALESCPNNIAGRRTTICP